MKAPVTLTAGAAAPARTEPPAEGRRRLVARGAVINSVFLAGLGGVNLLKSFVVASFLTASQFGVWSILFLALALVGALKAAAVSDKYVQQQEPDQEAAFQKAFTLELLSALAMTVAMGVAVPLLVLAYGTEELLLPGLVAALILPGMALQAPIWIHYRRMEFLRQRLLMAVDPLVGFAVTIPLAIAGLGYWSLVAGAVAGAWVGGVVAVLLSPYRLRLRYERETMRRYVSFSWPLMTAAGAGLLIAQLSMFFGDLALGLAGAGAIGLAATYAAYTDRVDSVLTQAIYPAVCRVVERRDLLLEAFVKSNRLALMWGMPFGIALSLFAPDLVHFALGEQWEDAIVLLQVFGLMAAVNHIGFNWTAFYRAAGMTRPVAIVTAAALSVFLAVALPLLMIDGLNGFAAGIGFMTLVSLLFRAYYVGWLFPKFQVALHTLRAIAPTVPAAAAVLATRAATESATLTASLLELALYVGVTAVATFALERRLIREAISYLRRVAPVGPTPA